MEECPASLLFMSRDEGRPLVLDPDLFGRVGGGLVDLLESHSADQEGSKSRAAGLPSQQEQEYRQQPVVGLEGKEPTASSSSIFDTPTGSEPLLSELQYLDPRVAITVEEANATASSASAGNTLVAIATAVDRLEPNGFLVSNGDNHPSPPHLGPVHVTLDLPELGIKPQSILDTCCLVESLQEARSPSSLSASCAIPRGVSFAPSSSFPNSFSARDDWDMWAETWRAAGKPTGDDGVSRGGGQNMADSRAVTMLAWDHLDDKVPASLSKLSPFVSESSARVFNALYQRHTKDAFSLGTSIQVVPQRSLIQQVFLLIQGTPSALFSYNANKQVFELTADHVRIQSSSETSMARLLHQFMATGTHMRRLIHVADLCIHHPEGMGLIRIAFGRALWSYLSKLQSTMLEMQDHWPRDLGGLSGILELHECTREMSITLEQLAKLCCCHISQDMGDEHVSRFGFHLPHGAGLLTLLFDHIDKTPSVDGLWSVLLTSILEQTSQPYCNMLSRWLGITPEASDQDSTKDVSSAAASRTAESPSVFQFGDHIHRHLQGLDSFSEFFVQSKSEWVFEGSHPLLLLQESDGRFGADIDDWVHGERGLKSWNDEFEINSSCPPAAFISDDLAQKVLEAGKALQMMLGYDGQHPLSIAASLQPLRWVFSQRELKDDRRQREEQRRMIMSRMVERLRARGFLHDRLPSMDLDPPSQGAPPSPLDNMMMHIELPASLHSNAAAVLLDFPGVEEQNSSWNPFAHREQLGEFFSYNVQSGEAPTAAVQEKTCVYTMEMLLGSGDGQEHGQQQQQQQQEYGLLPMAILAQECISYPLKAHAELIDTCFTSFFFHDLHLLDHWRIMDRFMLMRDGIFVTRLSEALFDDESGFIQQQLDKAAVAEEHGRRHNGSGGSHKATVPWPPRGGELEAALRTVLLDVFQDTEPTSALQANVLDDILAFAVKDYSNEVNLCRDIHAMEALDFLYLDYRSPSPIQALILQPQIMEKYARLFTFHLRLLRVHASMRQCFRHLKMLSRQCSSRQKTTSSLLRCQGAALEAVDLEFLQQFRFEAAQILEGLRGYLFDTAVGANWTRFLKRMEATKARVEARLLMEGGTSTDRQGITLPSPHDCVTKEMACEEDQYEDDKDSIDCTNDWVDSLPAIQEAHEQVLEQILVQALLKRKQRPVLKVVHEVLSCVVQLCKLVRELLQAQGAATADRGDEEGEDMEGDEEEEAGQSIATTVQEILQSIRGQHGRFQSACTMLTRVLGALDASMATGATNLPFGKQEDGRTRFLQQLLVRLGKGQVVAES